MNKSGIIPLEYKVLVLPNKPEEKTQGGIFIPDDLRDKEEMAEIEGTLIDHGPDAFTYENGAPWTLSPKVNSVIFFAKYAGVYCKGDDGKNYRLINDKDVLAIREKSND